MSSKNIVRIMESFFHFSYSSGIVRDVQRWMIEPGHQEEKEDALHELWECLEVQPEASFQQSWERVKSKTGLSPRPVFRNIRRLRRLVAIFVAGMLVAGGSFVFFRQPAVVEVVTGNNEQKYFRLPDNSEIWLNSGSRISYAAGFRDSIRRIVLVGEACFQVSPDKTKAFVVEAANMEVRALGTAFNISAYPSDSRTIATLNHGKIQVHIRTGEEEQLKYVLEPRQQMIFYKDEQRVSVNTVSGELTGWKEGQLIFRDATLSDIMNALQRRYDVDFDYQASEFPADLYTVKFSGQEDIGRVLEVLGDVVGGEFVEGSELKAKSYRLKAGRK